MNDKKIEEKAKTPEQKAHEAYDFNSSLPKKYQIEAYFWIDWFVKGYDRAIADQQDTLTQHKEALRYLAEGIGAILPKMRDLESENVDYELLCLDCTLALKEIQMIFTCPYKQLLSNE